MGDGARIVAEARQWIGTPFHLEAAVKGVGCDCKGTIAGPARACGRPEADSVEALATGYARRIDQRQLADGLARLFDPVEGELAPGDVLLLAVGLRRQPIHLALYVGKGRMIHSYSKGPQMVVEVPMGRVWRDAVVSAWRWRELMEDRKDG